MWKRVLVLAGLGILAQVATHWPGAITMPGLLQGMADSRRFQPLSDHIYRFSSFVLKSSLAVGMHGTDERIGVESYRTGIRFFADLIVLEAGEPRAADRTGEEG